MELFECATVAWGWLENRWALHLLPLLSGEAPHATQLLPPFVQLEYQSIKRAVLQGMAGHQSNPGDLFSP